MFPFQLVPLDGYAFVTLRRHCPSAAADNGRPLEEHLSAIRELAEKQQAGMSPPARPPRLLPRRRGCWADFMRVAEVLERFLLDRRFPLVRRLAHGLKFCELFEQCRLKKFSGQRLQELLAMLEDLALGQTAGVFDRRWPPRRAGGLLFRQIALESVRLHPDFVIEKSWRERWRLIVLALAFARGRGRLPHIHPCFPENTFEGLDTPLGPLTNEVLRPLEAYFEAAAASKQYAVLGHGRWSLVESFRALAAVPCGGDVASAAALRASAADGGGHAGGGGGDRPCPKTIRPWPAAGIGAASPR